MKNNKKTETTTETKNEAVNTATLRMTVASFAAYLTIALPYNAAMAADWMPAQQVAANNAPVMVAQAAAPQAALPANSSKLFQISKDDVGAAIAEQLQQQGIAKKATATMNPTESGILYSADHPLQLAIHGLQVDPTSHKWQAQADIISNHQTESVKPIAGFYQAMAQVPMLVRTVSRGDVITSGDLVMHDLPETQLRKDTVSDMQGLVGKSPRAQISPGRAIRSSELSNPIVIHRGEPVEMSYTTKYMNIKTTGLALDDGELGGMLRVKNTKSEKAVTTRVIGAGKVEANLDASS